MKKTSAFQESGFDIQNVKKLVIEVKEVQLLNLPNTNQDQKKRRLDSKIQSKNLPPVIVSLSQPLNTLPLDYQNMIINQSNLSLNTYSGSFLLVSDSQPGRENNEYRN